MLAAWGVFVEPMLLTRVKRYALTPPGWPSGLKLTAAVLADIHACRPWMTPERIRGLVERTNALGADVILLLGDYVSGMRMTAEPVEPTQWAGFLSGLSAPLGVHAVLGNHDWWEDPSAQARGAGPMIARRALESAGIPVYENDTVRLEKDGQAFWLAGLGDQLALRPGKEWNRERFTGVDDLDATLKQTAPGEPVILLAHEPDIFPDVPARVTLTVSGHTHGGQVRLFGWSPVVPSRFGNRFAYGHIDEDGRHLIVSGGLGFSIFPIRFGVRPEILLIEIG
ncbi:MAG: metallophosphoesterase [Phyllobacteriaceae bacterium]|nr:metallophosphoesterase [Phyllobacteriaceae bacterium]